MSVAFTGAAHVWVGRAFSEFGCQGLEFGDGQVIASSDGGVTWKQEYRGAVIPDEMQFLDDAHGWIAGCAGQHYTGDPCHGRLLLTSDGGATWTTVGTYEGRTIVQVSFVSPLDGWVLLDTCDLQCNPGKAQLVATTDGGASWHDVTLPAAMYPYALQRSGAAQGWVLAFQHLLITDDAGATWRTVEVPGGKVLDFVDAQHGWIGARGGAANGMAAKQIYATSDGGNTWQVVAQTYYGSLTPRAGIGDLTLDGGVTSLFFVDDRDGWMATEGRASVVLHTNDGGHTWSGVDVGVTPISHIAFADANDGWAWGGVFLIHTTDGGAHWSQLAIP